MKNSHWETLISGDYFDLNESDYSSISSSQSFRVVFENREDAEKATEWLKAQGGEYVEDIQLSIIHDNEQISQSTGIDANWEVNNYTE